MNTLKKKLLAILMVSAICLSVLPASASTNDSNSDSSSTTKSWRVPVGSFIQDYMTNTWTDERWQQELTAMKDAGMDMLIYSPSVIKNGNSVKTNYPSKLFPNKNMYGNNDTVDACLRNCEKAGFKVLITLNQDPGQFWKFGWQISTTEPNVYRQYWDDNAVISNEVADELYSMYKSKYPDAFYGWYWVHEFWNYTICTNAYEGKSASDSTAADPSVYTDIIAEHAFNPVLDHLTQLDSSMPILFSSFTNPSLCTTDALTTYWTAIISKTHFREGDIWAPMDGMGGKVQTLDTLDEWTAATAAAAKANPNLHFWINNEDQSSNEGDDCVYTIDSVTKQIAITAKYAENNVFFTWNHFYSPYNTLPGYNETYMQYVKTGAIEKNAPTAVDSNTFKAVKVTDGYRVEWKEPTDDIGVAEYYVYDSNGRQVDYIHTHRKDTGNDPGVLPVSVLQAGTYTVVAVDFAGNRSPATTLKVSDDLLPTTTSTTGTSPTTSTTGTNPSNETTGTSVNTTNTTKAATQSNTVVTTTAANSTEQSPKTGSALPATAILLAVVTAGVGFAVKSKRK